MAPCFTGHGETLLACNQRGARAVRFGCAISRWRRGLQGLMTRRPGGSVNQPLPLVARPKPRSYSACISFGSSALSPPMIAWSGRGGVSTVVSGLIAVASARICFDNEVDFSDNRNLVVAAITRVPGTGDYTLRFGSFTLGVIGTTTFGAILRWALPGRGGAAK